MKRMFPATYDFGSSEWAIKEIAEADQGLGTDREASCYHAQQTISIRTELTKAVFGE